MVVSCKGPLEVQGKALVGKGANQSKNCVFSAFFSIHKNAEFNSESQHMNEFYILLFCSILTMSISTCSKRV